MYINIFHKTKSFWYHLHHDNYTGNNNPVLEDYSDGWIGGRRVWIELRFCHKCTRERLVSYFVFVRSIKPYIWMSISSTVREANLPMHSMIMSISWWHHVCCSIYFNHSIVVQLSEIFMLFNSSFGLFFWGGFLWMEISSTSPQRYQRRVGFIQL